MSLDNTSVFFDNCTTNEDRMTYCSRDIRHNDKDSFLSVWAIVCPLTNLTSWKIQILKIWKKVWRSYYFTLVYHKWYNIMYDSWDMECDRQFFVTVSHFLPFYPTNDSKNQISLKIRKCLEISSFYTCVP